MRSPPPVNPRVLALAAALVGLALSALVLLARVEPEPPSVRYVRVEEGEPVAVDLGPLSEPFPPADGAEDPVDDPTTAWQRHQVRGILAEMHQCGSRPPPIACEGRFCVVRNTWPTSFFEAWEQQISYAPGVFARRALGRLTGVEALDDCTGEPRPDLRSVMIRGPDAGSRVPCWGVLPHDPAQPKPLQLDPPPEKQEIARALCDRLW